MMRQAAAHLREMTESDLDEVVQIERQIHTHPWTRGMFADSLASGYWCKVYTRDAATAGYAILMPAPDEVQLLDIGIAPAFQRQGLGYELLDRIMNLMSDAGYARMLLEVRRSNSAARALYRKAGFAEIGVRRDYYPAQQGREDALVMERVLQ